MVIFFEILVAVGTAGLTIAKIVEDNKKKNEK